jgi:hypothetical protein
MRRALRDDDIVEIVGETVLEWRHSQTIACVADVHLGEQKLTEGEA